MVSFVEYVKNNSSVINSDNPVIKHLIKRVHCICFEDEVENKLSYIGVIANRISDEFYKDNDYYSSEIWDFISSESLSIWNSHWVSF